MRDDLEDVLRDGSLIRLVFAIAIGWSLYQLAHGVASFIDALFTHLPNGLDSAPGSIGGGLTWIVGHRYITLDGIVTGLIELTFVLVAAVLVRCRFPADDAEPLNLD